MKKARPWIILFAFPTVLSIYIGAGFSLATIFHRYLLDEAALSWDDIGQTLSLRVWAGLGGVLLGALMAIGVGPWPVVAAGLSLAALAAAGLAAGPPDLAPDLFVFLYFASGVAQPAIWAGAARALQGGKEHLRNALFAGGYVALNMTAITTSVLVHQVFADDTHHRLFFTLAALSFGVAIIIAAVGAIADLLAERKESKIGSGFGSSWRPIVAPLILIAVVGIPWAILLHGTTAQIFALNDLEPGRDTTMLVELLNPLIVTLVGTVLAIACVLMHVFKAAPRTTVLIAVGLFVAALGIVPLAMLPSGWLGLMTSIVLFSTGEAFVGPLFVSRLCGDVPWRLSTAAVGLWLIVSGLAGQIIPTLIERGDDGQAPWSAAVLGASVVLGIVGGVLVLLSIPPKKWLTPPESSDTPPQAPAS